LERTLLSEVDASTALMDVFHAWPDPFVWMLQHVGRFWEGGCDLLRGDATYMDLTYAFGAPGHALLGPASAIGRFVSARRVARAARAA
ncbi:MAG: hypothetical protein WD800_07260, partial [Dehalococcoidia bacterium]